MILMLDLEMDVHLHARYKMGMNVLKQVNYVNQSVEMELLFDL